MLDTARDLLVRVLPVLVAVVAVVALIWLLAGRVDDPRVELPDDPPATAPSR